jgi:hypothetical protein
MTTNPRPGLINGGASSAKDTCKSSARLASEATFTPAADKYVLPIFELFRPRPELDKPSTITAHSVGERRGFLDLPPWNQLIGEILQRHAPSDMEQVARRIDAVRLDEIGWGHQPFG